MLIRPVRIDDCDHVLALAKRAGIGMSSLPPDAHVLETKIINSVNSFAQTLERPELASFLFVMEDTATGEVVGTTGIAAHVGRSHPFYSYKISTVVQHNSELDIYTQNHVLHMVNDYTDATEIGSLFLLPDYRRDGIGRFLSRSRYLMLAQFPRLFSDTVIAEIRGVSTPDGHAPFYDHLARHFFGMNFAEADYICATQGNQFIADLMPKYPIYMELLPKEAQAVIGVPLPESAAAMGLLIREGFSYQGYVDVFDGGPTLQVPRSKIRAIQKSRRRQVERIISATDSQDYMIATTKLSSYAVFRDKVHITEDGKIHITQQTADALKVGIGDVLRITPT